MADAEGAAGAALLHEGHNQEGNSTDALLFVTVALFLGIFSRSFLRWTRLPYTALLLVRLSLGVKPACQCSGLTDRCLLQIWGVLIGIGGLAYVAQNPAHVSAGCQQAQLKDCKACRE